MPKISKEPILIGVEVLIRNGNQLLLGKRGPKAFGAGTWALPGGHLEFGERLDEAITREIAEEIGLKIDPKALKQVSIIDDINKDILRHYIHVSYELQVPDFTPKLLEPDQCDEWRYFSMEELPLDNFFPPHAELIQNYLAKHLKA